jgi:hypothetical protein
MPQIDRPICFSHAAVSTILAFLTLLLAQSAASAAAPKRMALLVANGAYAQTTRLLNPPNDVAAIAAKLKELGFQVRVEGDLDARRFAEVLQEFSSALDKETDALFYYAGHGLQFRGENLLVGIDARLQNEATLQFETYQLNSVINQLEGRAGTVLLFWDACRNNPLAEQLVRSVGPVATRDLSLKTRGGAAPLPERGGDTLIVFSAEPGKQALDGTSALSPFAEALGRHMASSNLEVEVMLKRVTAEVLQKTQQFQKPERLSKLTHEFYFRSEGAAETAEANEIRRLREQLALLQREPAPALRRFKIVGSDDPTFRKAPAVTASGPTPVMRGVPGTASSPARQETGSLAPGVTAGAPSGVNVVIAVDQKASIIVRRLRLSPDGKLLAVGDDEGLVRIVRLETFEVVRTIRAHTQRVSDLDFSPDNRTLLSAGRDGAIRYWDVESGRQLRELRIPNSIPYSARMNSASPDRWVIMGDRNGFLYAWDLPKGRTITNVKLHEGPVLSVGYQPGGGGAFFSAGGDGQLQVRMPEGQRYAVKAHEGSMFQASYSASGRLLYTVGSDRKAKIWETAKLQQQQPQAVLEGHLRYVLTTDMSLDEKTLATGGADKAINLWDVASGKLLARLQGHTSDVEALSFSPNGKFVVSTSEDRSVRIWSVENREELVRLFFQRNGEKYAGVTLENQIFGDRDSGLLSVYIDGRQAAGADADRVVQYIGRGIAVIDSEK